ncbi:MAG: hypothetical protein QNK37_28800 [Acidobacteriota bacterium]|nr:hypothetical protein [Acidobacteriota bacterium]
MKKLIATALTALLFMPATLAGENKFLRFELTDYSTATPTEVKVRIPLSLLAAFSEKFDEAISEVEFDDRDIDFKEIWKEVRAAGPNEYVEVNTEETKLKISTTETHVNVKATGENGETVTASVPLELGDLLFGYGDRTADDLIEALGNFTDQDLLTVEGEKMEARAWIETN